MSQIHIKTPEEIEKMRKAGALTAQTLEMLIPHVRPGVSTQELDTLAESFMRDHGAIPAPLLEGFPKATCISVNQVVCHGIPGDKKLKKGDILNIDISLKLDGYYGDASRMYCVGKPSILARRLIQTTQRCLYEAIQKVAPGVYLGDLGFCIQSLAEQERFTVVREFCGHGIGRALHEKDTQVLHYGRPGTGYRLVPGMVFTIEPMINAGERHIQILPDDWTVVTKDHSLSAQWEHTVAVTEDGFEILTLRSEEDFPNLLAF